jgi:hypothetical protein
MYRPEELKVLMRIKELLYERRYTIAGARRTLLADRKDTAVQQTEMGFADADRKLILGEVKEELKRIALRLREPEAARR